MIIDHVQCIYYIHINVFICRDYIEINFQLLYTKFLILHIYVYYTITNTIKI